MMVTPSCLWRGRNLGLPSAGRSNLFPNGCFGSQGRLGRECPISIEQFAKAAIAGVNLKFMAAYLKLGCPRRTISFITVYTF
jgi:hypothetical protein